MVMMDLRDVLRDILGSYRVKAPMSLYPVKIGDFLTGKATRHRIDADLPPRLLNITYAAPWLPSEFSVKK